MLLWSTLSISHSLHSITMNQGLASDACHSQLWWPYVHPSVPSFASVCWPCVDSLRYFTNVTSSTCLSSAACWAYLQLGPITNLLGPAIDSCLSTDCKYAYLLTAIFANLCQCTHTLMLFVCFALLVFQSQKPFREQQ